LSAPFRRPETVPEPVLRTLGRKEFAVPVIAANIAALAVAGIFYAYRDGYVAHLRRTKLVRERIAYMLWTAAQQLA
jgi:hypothetical protein